MIGVDPTKCVGSATCVGIAPNAFRLAGDGKSMPKDPYITPDDDVVEAAESCPVQAITLDIPDPAA